MFLAHQEGNRMEIKVIKRYNIKRIGTNCEYIEIVKCPYCKAEYARSVKEGCFNVDIEPAFCPTCNYPFNDSTIDQELNPSRRLNNDREERKGS